MPDKSERASVNGAMVAAVGSAAPLGYVLVGYLVEAAGARVGVAACAIVYLLVASAVVLNPAMRRIAGPGTIR